MEACNHSIYTDKLEIICVKLERKKSHHYYSTFFESFIELDKHIDCIPSVSYQLHGLQKAADPITLFIFCFNQNDVKNRFERRGDSKIAVASILSVSLTDIWKQVDRWNPAYCICWFDKQTLEDVDKTEYLAQLFLTCIPPPSVRSSICVLNVADNDYQTLAIDVKMALSSYKIRTKTSNVCQFSGLDGTLDSLLVERLELVRNNAKYVLEHIRSEFFSKESLEEIPILRTEQLSVQNFSGSPTCEEIMEVILKTFPKVDRRLLIMSISSSLRRKFIKRCVTATLLIFLLIVQFLCYTESYISFMAEMGLILLLLGLCMKDPYLYIEQICYTVRKYNTFISKIRQKFDHIEQLYNKLDHTGRGVIHSGTYDERVHNIEINSEIGFDGVKI